MVAQFGADSLRVYLLFVAPFDQEVEWTDEGINGARRFLGRVWDLVCRTCAEANGQRFDAIDPELLRLRHGTVMRVTNDFERFHFNTAIAARMELINVLSERYRVGSWQTATFQETVETLVRLLAPAAPFIAEGLWQHTGGFGRAAPGSPLAGEATTPFGPAGSIHAQEWPTWDEALTRDEVTTIVVQVNGRVRDRLTLPVDAEEAEVRAAALARPQVQKFVSEPDRARFIYVKGRMLNVVTGVGEQH